MDHALPGFKYDPTIKPEHGMTSMLGYLQIGPLISYALGNVVVDLVKIVPCPVEKVAIGRMLIKRSPFVGHV